MAEITAELGEGTHVTLGNGRHTWHGDEDTDKGGADLGPNAYELLLGALAACTLITLRLYCRHKGIRLDSVSARYRHEKVAAPAGSDRRGSVDRISGHVTLRGRFDDAERERLTQIVSRCPVHRSLEAGPQIVDTVQFL